MDALLTGVVERGGLATTVDIRPLAWKVDPEMSMQDIGQHLIYLSDAADPPQLERPFGYRDPRGDNQARRAWLRVHRPDQLVHDTQVWRLTLTCRRALLDRAAAVGAPPADPSVAGALTADLIEHASVVVPAATGYRPARLIALLSEHGAVEAVRRLSDAYRFDESDGFLALVEAGHPELTLEAFLLSDGRSRHLFAEVDLRTARTRLLRHHHDPPGDLGR